MIFTEATAMEVQIIGMTDLVAFKGNREGLIVVLDLEADFQAVLNRFAAKLSETRGFLAGSSVSVDVGSRDLEAGQVAALMGILEHYHLRLRRILAGPRCREEILRNRQEVEKVEQEAVSSHNPVRGRKKKRRPKVTAGEQIAVERLEPEGATIPEQPDRELPERSSTAEKDEIPVLKLKKPASPRADIISEEQTILIQRTIRSGQRVFYAGNVVVLGDVNPGAEIIAGGNIICMGTFRGIAHAGAHGADNSVVAALRLEPSQLRIAGFITRAPDGDFSQSMQPEIARVQDGVVIIEQYQPGSDRYTRKIGKGGA